MSLFSTSGRYWLVGVVVIVSLMAPTAAAAVPSRQEVLQMLDREPMTPANWSRWRPRLLEWIGDPGRTADPAYHAAWAMILNQADQNGELTGDFANDAFAWYALGRAELSGAKKGKILDAARRSENATRRSLQLDANFARAQRNLALVLFIQETEEWRAGAAPQSSKQFKAEQALALAQRLDPTLSVAVIPGQAALYKEQYTRAESLLLAAARESPEDADTANQLAQAIVLNPKRTSGRVELIEPLAKRFPNDGYLSCFFALAKALEEDPRGAVREFERARTLGVNPAEVFSPELMKSIEDAAAPTWLEILGWGSAYFLGFYAVVMLLMAGGGCFLAGRTRGTGALDLLGHGSEELLVTQGQVVRSRHETGLARLYALALFVGLILFYVAIPFVILGFLAGTCLLLYLIFMLPRIPIKLLIIVVVIGLGGAWAVLKSVFASPGRGSFGIKKSPTECLKLYGVLAEVAQRVDTQAVDEVFLAPGSSVSVHQEGRGPFGVLGVKKRVLTLGVSTLNVLSVGELKSVLAHEYAHFSHSDTFYSRFFYQVNLSIDQALTGIGQSGGNLSYVNPFYWFLYLYYKAYNMLASGYSRSREFLADRMASCLYGSDVFANALTHVSTDGSLFEATMFQSVDALLREGKSFVNMYESFRGFRAEKETEEAREKRYQKLLDERPSLFSSHPTFAERIAAIAELPLAGQMENTPAMQLFENPEEIEKELTEYMTGYVNHLHQLQAAARA